MREVHRQRNDRTRNCRYGATTLRTVAISDTPNLQVNNPIISSAQAQQRGGGYIQVTCETKH